MRGQLVSNDIVDHAGEHGWNTMKDSGIVFDDGVDRSWSAESGSGENAGRTVEESGEKCRHQTKAVKEGCWIHEDIICGHHKAATYEIGIVG